MSTILGIWHLVLEGGQEKAFRTPAGVQITNVSFGEEIVDVNSRSVVKLTFKSLSSSDDGDDEGDDDDDDEGDELGLQDATTVLCALTPGKIEQVQVNLTLGSDEDFLLQVTGKNTVYLTGQYIDQHLQDEEPFDSELDSDDEDAYDLRDVSSDVEMHPDDLDNVDTDGDRFEEVEDKEPLKPAKRPRESDIAGEDKVGKAEKKKKLKADNGKAIPVETPSDQQKSEKKEKKSRKQDKKVEEVVKEKKEEEIPKKGSKLPKKTIAGGIVVQDHSIGTGPMAKKGDTLKLRYVGKLTNGKEFDKNTHGKPFTFHLGKGEVIKGWDEGIVGMQVGGERVLTIPANMGYGSRGQEGIPPNSTLVFEVKLLQIK